MGEAKPRTEGHGGEVELWKSETDVQSDAAGSDAGNTAALPGVSRRARVASEDAVTAAMLLWSWLQG